MESVSSLTSARSGGTAHALSQAHQAAVDRDADRMQEFLDEMEINPLDEIRRAMRSGIVTGVVLTLLVGGIVGGAALWLGMALGHVAVMEWLLQPIGLRGLTPVIAGLWPGHEAQAQAQAQAHALLALGLAAAPAAVMGGGLAATRPAGPVQMLKWSLVGELMKHSEFRTETDGTPTLVVQVLQPRGGLPFVAMRHGRHDEVEAMRALARTLTVGTQVLLQGRGFVVVRVDQQEMLQPVVCTGLHLFVGGGAVPDEALLQPVPTPGTPGQRCALVKPLPVLPTASVGIDRKRAAAGERDDSDLFGAYPAVHGGQA